MPHRTVAAESSLKPASLKLASLLLAATMLVQPGTARGDEPSGTPPGVLLAKSYGPSFPAMEEPARDGSGAPTLVVQQGFGCIILGTTGTVAAMGASSLNVVQHVAGGLVAPANATVLALGLVGVVFATYCSIGAAMTPLYLYMTGSSVGEPAAPPPTQARTPPTPAVHPASVRNPAFRSGVLSGATDRSPRESTGPRQP